jgi:hypothetical protein
MASSTGLINRALALLGAKRIISLDDTTAVGQLVRDTYDEIRQSLLQAHTWPFSTFLYQLGRETTPPLYGRAFAYRKPQATDQHGELLRTIGIFTDVDMKYWALRFIDLGPIVYSDWPPNGPSR